MIKIFYPTTILKIIKAIFRKVKLYSNNGFPYGRTLVIEKIIRDNNFKTVVELGVFDGKNLFYLAKKFPNTQFIGIDLWQYFPTNRVIRLPLNSQEEWDTLYNSLLKKSAELNNLKLIRGHSSKDSRTFKDGSVDFVFIDANHDYQFVKDDILAWLPKISKNGLIGGHDYSLGWLGVIKAVTEIFGTDAIDVLDNAVWVTDPKNKTE